ncbi:erythrocyte membrane protein 1 (PfEMP1), truncated, putative [Plasmodium sp. gorilla clade G2]|uniref:erythrocyte membrane protein 1 (PfEMP1), truncated, putative n=1 Tax=Plasmodium sp. gorilla clade G2 TaxID=880535 RepID=UPI000D297485|nr:erythrocyte membrane protein 1 (PfEMP1), truncated, putative [Plasmodium sp. gorilla clade G2]SOV20454.1 erythrocyte membrane protein 1 (PfEMP1), truncated, putative [Plasmodium sp. gorilla clade G2]
MEDRLKSSKDVLPVINIAGKTVLRSENCDKLNITVEDNILELNNNGSRIQIVTARSGCPDLKTSKDIHVPLRRRSLLVEGIDQYLEEIKKKSTDEKTLKEAIEGKISAQIKIGEVAGQLTKGMIGGLSREISNIIHKKHKNDHTSFCKEWERTMDDYFKLLQGIDIVDENDTINIQCIIKNIETKVGGKDKFRSAWSSHFKELVQDLQTNHFKDPSTRRSCSVDHSNKTQCVRFFEEWSEEFCKLKKDLGDMMIENCKGDKSNVDKDECKNVCNIYKKFLVETKPYFDNYINICTHTKYADNGQSQNELQEMLKTSASTSTTECCTELGHCSVDELFDVKKDKGNLIFNCMCQGGIHTEKRDSEPKCQKYKDPVNVAGTQIPAPTLSGAGQGVSVTTTSVPGPKTVMQIAQDIQSQAKKDAEGRLGGGKLDDLKGNIENAQFKNRNKGSDFNGDPCKMDKSKHTNDVRSDGEPCKGKGGDNPDRFVIGKQWGTKKGEVDQNNNEVLLPPRRLDMCTSNLENLARSGQNPDFINNGSVNDSFTGDVLLAAKEEAENILKLYGNSNDQSGMCRAVRASFADLGDIIRGTDIWEKNDDMKNLQGHLDKIFAKIKDEKGNGKYTGGENESPPYKTLRSDWWSANRDQVWDAIKCQIGDLFAASDEKIDRATGKVVGAFCGYNDTTPVDDYIPQKLRWLAEWNENYCKQMKKDFNAVKEQCTLCKNIGEGKCEKDNKKCDMCSGMCDTYKENVEKWKTQWTKHQQQYTSLYSNPNGNDKEFIQKLKQNNNYSNSADFVDSMGGYRYCKDTTQRETKEQGNEDYLFKEKPKEFKDECGCKEKGGSSSPSPKVPPAVTPPKSQDIQDCEKTFGNNGTPNPGNVQLSEWDCIQDNDMCIDISKSKTDHNISNFKDKFSDIFEDWLTSFFNEQQNVKSKSSDCTNITPSSGDCDGKKCRDKCPCYEKWVKRKTNEWRHFKNYYRDFQTINPTKWMSSFKSVGNDADTYVKKKKQSELSKAYQSTSGTKSNNITIQDILTEESKKVTECLKNCPIKIECKDKGFGNPWKCGDTAASGAKQAGGTTNNMCTKNEGDDDDRKQPGSGKNSGSSTSGGDQTQLFYDSFKEWIHDIENMLDMSKKLIEESCKNLKTKTTGEKECTKCNDLCNCFKELKGKIDDQWTKQQNNYNHHKDKGKDNMQNLDLDIYLEAECILNEGVKSEKMQSIQGEYEDLDSKCDKLRGTEKNYVQALINNSEKDREKICHECENQTTKPSPTDKCDGIGNASNCQTKNYNELDPKKGNKERNKEWLCKNIQNTSTDVKQDVCVPPRTQPLCIANMYTKQAIVDNAFSSEENMKKALKAAIKKETELLYTYYTTTKKKTGTPPPGFCEAAYRSFNDFKHMVLGDMLWKPESIKKVQEKIGEIIKQSGTSGKTVTREEWWKQHEVEFWEAAKCGIKDSGNKSATGDCPRLINDDDQFEWWAKEWSDDFYHKRHEVLKEFDKVCNTDRTGKNTDCEGTNGQMKANSKCKPKCDEYKNFLSKKRDEWNKNFKIYLQTKEEEANKNTSSVNTKEYSHPNVYLLYPCTYQNCDNKYMTALLSDKQYGDKEKICNCDTSKHTQDTDNPCDKNYTEYGCTEKKFDKNIWSSTYVTHPTDRGKVFAPPRRNSMCIGWLFSKIGDKDSSGKPLTKDAAKNQLRLKLIDAARGESHYLHKYYTKNSGTPDTTKYCSALRRSFYDYGDMVKGTDLWSAGYSPRVEKNIYDVFKMPDTAGGNTPSDMDIVKDRESWWNTHKREIWQAMNCGGTNKCDTSGSDYPTVYDSHDEFLRWFIEWGENFCTQKQHYMSELQTICMDKSCNTLCGGSTCEPCQKQCAKYHKWLFTKKGEWNGQKEKYKEEYKKQGAKYQNIYAHTKKKPDKYIEEYAKICEGADLNDVFKRQDNQYKPYKKKCKRCIDKLTQDVVQKIKYPGKSSPTDNIDSFCEKSCDNSGNESLYEKHIEKDDKYSKIKGQSNCEGLKKAAEGKKIKWNNSDEKDYEYLKNRQVPAEVYLPTRKEKICFRGLDGKYDNTPNEVKDEKSLFEHLIKLAAIEGHNLGEYYKAKKGKGQNDEKYKYEVSECSALKYSFLDLRDIILGHDMTETDKEETEKNLQKIFKEEYDDDKDAGKPGSTYRRNFWKSNEKCVWNAMKCGYKKGCDDTTTLSGCDQMPDDTTYPVGTTRDSGKNYQFLRWFAEWGEDYCGHYAKEFATLQDKCKDVDCKKTESEEQKKQQDCKSQCDKYQNFIKDWKKQYEKQKTKFEADKKQKNLYEKDKEANEASDARVFLHKKLQKACQNSSKPGASGSTECNCMSDISSPTTGGGTDTPKSLEEIPSEYQKQCECDTPRPPNPPKPMPNPNPQKPDSQKPNQKDTNPDSSSGPPDPNSGQPGSPGQGGGSQQPGGPKPDTTPSPGEPDSGQSSVHPPSPGVHPAGPSVQPAQQDKFKELDECPDTKQSYCSKYGKFSGRPGCRHKKTNYDSFENWNKLTLNEKDDNYGVQVPPRRKNLCFPMLYGSKLNKLTLDDFKKHLLNSAATEAKNLMNYHKDNEKLAFQAIKYSFGDYGNLIKGDDLNSKNDDIASKINEAITKLQSQNNNSVSSGGGTSATTTTKFERKNWWDKNKKHIWHVMLCQYTGTDKDQHCEDYKEIDNIPQFLRWLEEWARKYCSERTKLADMVSKECKTNIKNIDFIKPDKKDEKCVIALNSYKKLFHNRHLEWENLKKKYKKDKETKDTTSANSNSYTENDAEAYLKKRCPECICTYDDLEKISNYENDSNNVYKKLIQQSIYDTNENASILKKLLTFDEHGPEIAKKAFDAAGKIIPDALQVAKEAAKVAEELGKNVIMPVGILAGTNILSGLEKVISWFGSGSTSSQHPQPLPPAEPDAGASGGQHPVNPSPTTPQKPPTGDILTSTIPPVGIGVALGSIALLFYLK